jgi:hypothetical protein
MELSNEKTLEFIEGHRQYELLWNSRDKEYSNNTKKRDILALLAEKSCASVADVKAKIKTPSSSFHVSIKESCKNRLDLEKIYPRNGSPTNHSDVFCMWTHREEVIRLKR